MIKKYQTRGVIHCWANPDGTQKIESTGPLGKKRMETIDEEVTKATLDYLEKAKKSDKPFFLWWNSTRMHIHTHLKTGVARARPASASIPTAWSSTTRWSARSSTSSRSSASRTTPSSCTPPTTARRWPAGPMAAPRRSAARRTPTGRAAIACPCAIRWPGVIKPGTVDNDIFAHEDMLPTLLAAAGVPDVKEQLLKGMKVGDKTFKVHLDGYNITDALAGKAPDPRHEFFYFNDDGSLVALRYDQWKIVFAEQRAHGFDVWRGAVQCSAPSPDLQHPQLTRSRQASTLGPTGSWQVGSRLPAGPGAAIRRPSSWPRSRSSRRARRWAASASTRCWRR